MKPICRHTREYKYAVWRRSCGDLSPKQLKLSQRISLLQILNQLYILFEALLMIYGFVKTDAHNADIIVTDAG